ncbi:MAG: hypothetical protein JXM73_26415, partial [Anaerolineae bacterium]|nr:hypothetical protein [Anaerolineae bacterium]
MSKFFASLRTTPFKLPALRGMTVGAVIGLLLVVAALALLWPAPRASAESAPPLQPPDVQPQTGESVQLLSSDDSGITFQVSAPWDRLAVEPLTA